MVRLYVVLKAGASINHERKKVYFCSALGAAASLPQKSSPGVATLLQTNKEQMAKTDRSIRVDVHGMYVEDALALLRDRIARAPSGTEKIVVVHGYNRGTALKEAVRRLRAPRVVEVSPSFTNEGETVIWLRR